MELCEGCLMDVLRESMPPFAKRLEIAYDLMRSIAHMHRIGFVHRDIKSLNSFVADAEEEAEGEDTGVRLGDFGESVTFEAAVQEGPKIIGTSQW